MWFALLWRALRLGVGVIEPFECHVDNAKRARIGAVSTLSASSRAQFATSPCHEGPTAVARRPPPPPKPSSPAKPSSPPEAVLPPPAKPQPPAVESACIPRKCRERPEESVGRGGLTSLTRPHPIPFPEASSFAAAMYRPASATWSRACVPL